MNMSSYGTPIIPFGVILGKADKISIANEEIQVLHPTYSCGVGYNCVRFPFAPAAVAVALSLPKMVLKCLLFFLERFGLYKRPRKNRIEDVESQETQEHPIFNEM